MENKMMMMIVMLMMGIVVVDGSRSVSFWYAIDGSDMNDTVSVLYENRHAVTSVMVYCGPEVDNNGYLQLNVDPLCTNMFSQLKSFNVQPELVLNDGSTNATAMKLMWANDSTVQLLTDLAVKHDVYGLNIDLEPQKVPGTHDDAVLYAEWCSKLRASLNARGIRLTIDVASWSPMLDSYKILGPSVDRMMTMETYDASSMSQWTGYLDEFINGGEPDGTRAIGMGTWPATCSGKPCWTNTPESVGPRMKLIEQSGITEIACFRLYGQQHNKPANETWPQGWWWPALLQFRQS